MIKDVVCIKKEIKNRTVDKYLLPHNQKDNDKSNIGVANSCLKNWLRGPIWIISMHNAAITPLFFRSVNFSTNNTYQIKYSDMVIATISVNTFLASKLP